MTQKCSCHGSGYKHSQTVAAVIERPRYSPGLILEDSDLTSAVDYTQSLSRLLFRNLFGCGVICGLVVSVEKECGLAVTVAPGLALDGCGDPIEVPRPITITIDLNELKKIESEHNVEKPAEFWVVLCGREKMCAPRSLVCESDEFDGITQPTRIRSLAQVSLAFEPPECACGCRLRNESMWKYLNQLSPEDEIDCNHEHEHRVECAPDCGCGTACPCGCCLLLAHIAWGRYPGGTFEWKVANRGVRNFIRPQRLPDPAERPDGWRRAASETDVYWGIDDSVIAEGVQATLTDVSPGDRLNADQVAKVLNHARKSYTAASWAANFESPPSSGQAAQGADAQDVSDTAVPEAKKKPAAGGKAKAAEGQSKAKGKK